MDGFEEKIGEQEFRARVQIRDLDTQFGARDRHVRVCCIQRVAVERTDAVDAAEPEYLRVAARAAAVKSRVAQVLSLGSGT